MRFLSYLAGLLAVTLVLAVVTSVTALPSRPDVGLSQALYDLDGDGASDAATVSAGDPRHAIELQLSHTQTHLVLPFHSTAAETGSLWIQDLDGDGDADLLWKVTLPIHQVVIWLNDGYGRFDCLCPVDRQRSHETIGDSCITLPA